VAPPEPLEGSPEAFEEEPPIGAQHAASDDLAETYGAFAFLSPEGKARRAQRNKRLAIGAAVACALAALFIYLMRSSPEVVVTETPLVSPPPKAPAPPEVPLPVEAPVAESEPEEAPSPEAPLAPRVTAGRPTPIDPTDGRSAFTNLPGGPSVARYPDLPQATLVELEKAAKGKASSSKAE
jgi:hypothetical protein